MDVEISADSMASAVLEVETGPPQVLSGKHVQLGATHLLIGRPLDQLEVQVTHEDSCVSILLEISGCFTTEVGRPRDVSGTVKVLTTRVKQVDFVIVQRLSRFSLWLVVDNSTIGTN